MSDGVDPPEHGAHLEKESIFVGCAPRCIARFVVANAILLCHTKEPRPLRASTCGQCCNTHPIGRTEFSGASRGCCCGQSLTVRLPNRGSIQPSPERFPWCMSKCRLSHVSLGHCCALTLALCDPGRRRRGSTSSGTRRRPTRSSTRAARKSTRRSCSGRARSGTGRTTRCGTGMTSYSYTRLAQCCTWPLRASCGSQ